MNLQAILLMGSSGGGWQDFLPLIMIIVVFYFFMIRPQLKKQKDTKKFRESIAKGDKVVTIGGIHGKIVEMKEHAVVLEVAQDVRFTIDKSAISSEFAASENLQAASK